MKEGIENRLEEGVEGIGVLELGFAFLDCREQRRERSLSWEKRLKIYFVVSAGAKTRLPRFEDQKMK